MKSSFIFVALLLFATVGCQYTHDRQLNTASCVQGGPSPNIVAIFNNCYDTLGCQMPFCCGAVPDTFINLTVQYTAQQDVTGGTVLVAFTGATLTTPDSDLLKLPVPIALPPEIAQIALKLYPDICYDGPNSAFRGDFCPQTAGNVYTLKKSGFWPPLFNTATAVLEIKVDLKEGETQILCFKIYVRVIAPDILANPPPLPPLTSVPIIPVLVG